MDNDSVSDGRSSCFLPCRKLGVMRRMPCLPRNSLLVHPRSAMTALPGYSLSTRPLLWVISLSLMRPSMRSEINVGTPECEIPLKCLDGIPTFVFTIGCCLRFKVEWPLQLHRRTIDNNGYITIQCVEHTWQFLFDLSPAHPDGNLEQNCLKEFHPSDKDSRYWRFMYVESRNIYFCNTCHDMSLRGVVSF